MTSLLKPAIELTVEGVEAAKKEVDELADYFSDKTNKLFSFVF